MPHDAEPRARIVEIGGKSQELGDFVSLELATPFTVLVGRNAAGKSVLLHLINDFARQAARQAASLERYSRLDEFHCTAEIAGTQYRYTASGEMIVFEKTTRELEFQMWWSESCVDLSAGGAKLWSTERGVVAGLSAQVLVPPFTGLLALDPNSLPVEVAAVAGAFGQLFRHVTLIPAGLPAPLKREPNVFVREPSTGRFVMRGSSGSQRLDRVALQLMRWHEAGDESFERVQAVLRRIGVCASLEAKTFPGAGSEIAFIFIDGYQLDSASDGTLRVIEIIVALELAAAGALVMIEEPETGIHPGLCDRIMAEIDSAAEDLQLIISTHSPRILDRVQYHQLRHVRRNGSTRVGALTSGQVEAVKAFLDHEGTLSDFVLSPDFTDDDTEAD